MNEPGQPDERVAADEALAAAELPSNYFDLYKLAIEMADRISARRGVANSFFLTANTAVVALLATSDARWSLAAAGIVVAVAWWALLKSYRDLNAAKFEIILAMEKRLPVRVYGDEWDRLQRDPVGFSLRRETFRSWFAQYRELGRIERIVPWIFALIYAAEIVRDFMV